MIAIVDTGPLYAAVDADDRDHERSLNALQQYGLRLFVPAMVVAETSYLVGTRLGSSVEAAFLGSLSDIDVVAPLGDDWQRIAELVQKYADFPLGGTDASVVALAERLRTDLIITLDLRHFSAIKPSHSRPWRLLP